MPPDARKSPMLRLAPVDRGDSSTMLCAGNTRPETTRPAPARPGSPRLAANPERSRKPVQVDRERRARAAVGAENHAASAHEFDPVDPRWVLAVRAAGSIEGGRAAVLPPEQRARLLALGTRIGLRPFDSHLIIAIVQDAARTGSEVVDPQTRARLAMLPAANSLSRSESALGIGLRLAVAALLALAMVGTFIGWVEPG